MNARFSIYIFSLILPVLLPVFQQTRSWASIREFDLVIDYQEVNYTGNTVKAMTVNGGVPGPVLEMMEGDYVKIRVHNRMDVETSIHWHGLLLPNKEDGVPYLTTPPIKPGTTYMYEFPIKQSGTYWYHSHTGLQEQRGVYGGIVIHPLEPVIRAHKEQVLVLSDWTDEDPDEVLRTLKRGSEYYSLKKGAVQSVLGAWQADALGDTLKRSWNRMPPMDISDVAYDRFLVNGKPEYGIHANPFETVRLRIINASASTYFYLQFSGGPMRVVSADGLDVQPVELNRFLIAIAETYDVLLTVPASGFYEFRATAQDGSGYVSTYIGYGNRVSAPDVPRPNLYKMHSGMHMGPGMSAHGKKMTASPKKEPATMKMDAHRKMAAGAGHSMPMADMVMARPLAPYDKLRSPYSTELPPDRPWRTITLNLTGDMERYVWSFNGKTLTEVDNILIRHGENTRIIFNNETMMHHPIHLHGHFFRVVNDYGAYSPLKHTVDIPPNGRQVVEFFGSEDKDWFLHCHILYHMKVGMARVLQYEGSTVDPEIAESRKEPSNFLKKDTWYFWADVSLLSQMTEGYAVLANTRNSLNVAWEAGWDEEEYEVALTYDRYFNRFFKAFLGGVTEEDEDPRGILGVHYLLPLNIESFVWGDTDGDFRLAMEKDLRLTDRLAIFGEVEYDTERLWEWAAGAEWILGKNVSLMGKYHSEFGLGGGLAFRF